MKGLTTSRELELYCVAAGLIPYIPPVCMIPFAIQVGQVVSVSESQGAHPHKVTFYMSESSETASSSSGTAKVSSAALSDRSGSSTVEEPTTEAASKFYGHVLKAALTYPKRPHKLSRLCARGIPESLRSLVWRKLLDVATDDGGYYQFLEECRASQPLDRQLAVDVQRCHQYLPFLNSPYGRARLERILQLWLWTNPQTSYFQGFDSVCAVFVVVFAESESLAFSCFSEMMRKYLYSMQGSALTETLRVFRNLLHFLDPVLGYTLTQHKIGPDVYALPWLLTLFAHVFSLDKVCALWDALLFRSAVFPYFISAALLCKNRVELLKLPGESLLRDLQGLPHKADMSEILTLAEQLYRSTPYSATQPCFDVSPSILQNTYAPYITLQDALAAQAAFIDVRPKEQYLQQHLQDSINVPVRVTGENQGFPSLKLTESQVQALKKATQGKIIVVVGDQSLVAHSVRTKQFANILIKLKTPKVALLQGGFGCIGAELLASEQPSQSLLSRLKLR
jgi:TBC domain-containing protein kinase-like protein